MSEIQVGGIWGAVHDRWINLKKQEIVMPWAFLNAVENSADLYLESINAYIYGLPNSSIAQTVRCGEIALRKYLENKGEKSFSVKKWEKIVVVNVEDAHLVDLIEEHGNELRDKDEMHYFRTLHNKIHRNELLTDLDALNALDKITKQINHLFPFTEATVSIKCPYKFCGNVAPITFPFNSYFIGNEAKLTCNSQKHTMGFGRDFRVKLDGIKHFTVEQA